MSSRTFPYFFKFAFCRSDIFAPEESALGLHRNNQPNYTVTVLRLGNDPGLLVVNAPLPVIHRSSRMASCSTHFMSQDGLVNWAECFKRRNRTHFSNCSDLLSTALFWCQSSVWSRFSVWKTRPWKSGPAQKEFSEERWGGINRKLSLPVSLPFSALIEIPLGTDSNFTHIERKQSESESNALVSSFNESLAWNISSARDHQLALVLK